MTVINITGLQTAIGTTTPIRSGKVTAQYWAGRGAYIRVEDDQIVFPTPLEIGIADGILEQNLDVKPTGDECCLRLSIAFGALTYERYVEVPDVPSVDLEDLVDVDPATFAPAVTTGVLETILHALFDGMRFKRVTRDEYNDMPTPRPADVLFVITPTP